MPFPGIQGQMEGDAGKCRIQRYARLRDGASEFNQVSRPIRPLACSLSDVASPQKYAFRGKEDINIRARRNPLHVLVQCGVIMGACSQERCPGFIETAKTC